MYNMVKYSVTGYWHTENGIYTLGQILKRCLYNRYKSLDESMFIWRDETGRCDEMNRMSLGRVPEKFLVDNSKVAIFDWEGNTHMLPVMQTNMLNVYGEMNYWTVQPVAWDDGEFYKQLMNKKFDATNSAIITNSLYGTNDSLMIRHMVNLMVDGMLTLNQRMLVARAPFVFTVEGSPDADVSAYMNAIFNFKPWITTNAKGSLLQASISDINVAIDPTIIDSISYWESNILGYIGILSTDIHKRAQQSVSETNMPQEKILGRREEKLYCRQQACDWFNEICEGSKLTVISRFDEMAEQEEENGGMDTGPDSTREALGRYPTE